MQASKDGDADESPLVQAPTLTEHSTENNVSVHGDEITKCRENKGKGLPIDHGWAWAVFAGTVLYMFMFGGVRKNFGIFFVAFQTRFHSSASLTSLLTTTQNIVTSIAGLIVMTVGLRAISNRTSVMIGATITTASYTINAYSRDIRILFVSYGFMEAIGFAMMHNPIVATLAEYFDKRRAIVNGLAFSAASVGGLAFAPINSALFEHYGYTGTLMIVAGMLFHIILTGAVLRPLNLSERSTNTRVFNSKRNKSSSDIPLVEIHTDETSTKGTCNCDILKVIRDRPIENGDVRSNIRHECNNKLPTHLISPVQQLRDGYEFKSMLMRTNSLEGIKSCGGHVDSPLLPRQRSWSTGKRSTVPNTTNSLGLNKFVETISRSKVALYGSANEFIGSVGGIAQILDHLEHDDEPSQPNDTSCCHSVRTGVRKVLQLLDVSMFKSPVFCMILLLSFFSQSGSVAIIVFLAPHAKDVGLSGNQIGILMSIVGAGEMCSRFMAAIVSAKNWIRPTTILSIALASVGVAAHCVQFYKTFPAMAFFAVVVGMSCGLFISLYAVLVVDYLTLAKLRSCLGFGMMCHGISGAIIFPVAGIIRDKTGSYVITYHFLGTIILTAATISLLLPHIHKWQHKHMPEKTET